MLKDYPVERFVAEVASRSPAPGGGSVSALSGAQAAALLAMYCSLSLDRERFGEAVPLMEQAAPEASSLVRALLEAVDLDTAAFNRVIKAYRLPKETAAEKEQRRGAIREAVDEAARVPLQAARDCLRLLELIETVAGRGNAAAASDLGVSNLQAFAGLQGAVYNVRINLPSIKGEKAREEYAAQSAALLSEAERLFSDNRLVIEKQIG